ncbi:MAG: hypothetical protein UIT70_00230 [Clostridia bacterium]|nr:hypothetical protein [Clostridia bacterium]
MIKHSKTRQNDLERKIGAQLFCACKNYIIKLKKNNKLINELKNVKKLYQLLVEF